MKIRAFRPEDLAAIRLQPSQAWMRPIVDTPGYLAQMRASQAYTAEGDAGILLIGALTTIWLGRTHLTALLSVLVGPRELLRLTREVRAFLEGATGRIEATVDGTFKEGHRWLRVLGFQLETPGGMPGYRPDGGTSYLYARVK